MSYHYLLDIALILLSTKVLGLLTKKYQMPQVVGALLAGLIFGPACLNLLSETDFLIFVSVLLKLVSDDGMSKYLVLVIIFHLQVKLKIQLR